MMNKRSIQKRIGDIVLLAIMLFLFGGTIARVSGSALSEKVKHPRLFFKSNELSHLALSRTTTHKAEWKSLLSTCESLEMKDPILKPKSKLVFAFPEKIAAVALVQLLDPSQAYQETFEKHFWAIMNWKEWDEWIDGKGKGPANDLGVAQALIALTACYDWQYHNMTDEQRDFVSKKLIRIAHHFYNDYKRFHTESFAIMNCNHGTNVYAALSAVLYGADDVSDSYKEEWTACIDHKYETLTNQMNSNMSDGFSDEGATYFMFQLKTYMQWFELRRNGLNLPYGKPYEDLDWFRNASAYCLYSILPGGDDNFGGLARYADASPKFWGNPYSVFPSLAKNLQDPVAQWLSSELDLKGIQNFNSRKSRSRNSGGRPGFDVWRYIWKDANLESVDLNSLPNWHLFEDAGMYVWRSSWENDASYFTIKSGQHYQGHGQPDDGQFMLHRAGVPYIIDMGYSNPKYTNEHNVLLVNGKGQVGDGDVWSEFGEYPGNKEIWGKTDVIISTGKQARSDYFNLICDPTNMYPVKELQMWNREVVGWNGMFVMRDLMKATKEVELELLLHAYTSRKGKKDAYEYGKDRSVNPFRSSKDMQWVIDPQKGKAPLLLVKDLSDSKWSGEVEEAWFYDNYIRKKDGRGYVQLGSVLKRKQKAKNASSVLCFAFEDELSGMSISKLKEGEGLQVLNKKGELVKELAWNGVGKTSRLNFKGEMAGMEFQGAKAVAWFGRNITRISNKNVDLLSSDKALSVYASLGDNSSVLNFTTSEETNVKIILVSEPTSVKLNGEAVEYTYSNSVLSFVLGVGFNDKIQIAL